VNGRSTSRRFSVVSFHAHPDDETLLTGGTLARLAAEGHRVVLVTATHGDRGLAGRRDGTGQELARLRMAELEKAAGILGCARVVSLGFGDSGLRPDPDDETAFANAALRPAAERLADVLREEGADVLTIYDANGGYGHPDHVQVHRVGTVAAALAGTPVVLEATVPATLLRTALRVLHAVGHPLGSSPPLGVDRIYSSSGAITHRVRVTGSLRAKRAAMGAHASQRRGGGQTRVMAQFLRLPLPLFGLVFGHEWYVEQGRPPGPLTDDVFATLRTGRAPFAPARLGRRDVSQRHRRRR
jgi:LmbE family N-acetylglucosaminyl deacetylase